MENGAFAPKRANARFSIIFQIHSISKLSWSKGLIDSKLMSTHARSFFSLLPGRIRSNEANHRSLIEEREKVKRDLEVSLNFSHYFLHLQLNLCKTATHKVVFKTNYRLMQVKSIAECYKGGILQSAILLTFIKLPFVIKIFVLSIFEWPFYCNLSNDVCHFKSFIDILTIQDKVEICISLK